MTKETSGERICLVIGGATGFLGLKLVQTLTERYRVRILSPEPPQISLPGVECFIGDIRCYDDVLRACEGVDTVFHVAAIILASGLMPRDRRQHLYDVNVTGTQNVIDACVEAGVRRLVYTSSNNVVFDHEIAGGDESLPYATRFIDHYTKSKVLAEKAVLAANGTGRLLTCALRPGGIYGPGDRTILPRFMQSLRKGYFLFMIGNGSALGDSVYVENLVDAHLLAAEKLEKGSAVAGRSYFISDGEPSNYFTFVKPLVLSLGYRFPRTWIPAPIAYGAAYLAEIAFWLLKMPEPILTRSEVKKMTVSNYFSIDRARMELGYQPRVSQQEGLRRSREYCQSLLDNMETVERPALGWWMAVLGGMTLLASVAFGESAFLLFSSWTMVFISQLFLQGLFYCAVVIHCLEAVYAFYIAKQRGLDETAVGWALQTLLLGYPSLRLLLGATPKRRSA